MREFLPYIFVSYLVMVGAAIKYIRENKGNIDLENYLYIFLSILFAPIVLPCCVGAYLFKD